MLSFNYLLLLSSIWKATTIKILSNNTKCYRFGFWTIFRKMQFQNVKYLVWINDFNSKQIFFTWNRCISFSPIISPSFLKSILISLAISKNRIKKMAIYYVSFDDMKIILYKMQIKSHVSKKEKYYLILYDILK